MQTLTLTETEKRVLQSLHLRGFTGKMGSLNLGQRRKLMFGLVDKGLLTEQCKLTSLGLELSR